MSVVLSVGIYIEYLAPLPPTPPTTRPTSRPFIVVGPIIYNNPSQIRVDQDSPKVCSSSILHAFCISLAHFALWETWCVVGFEDIYILIRSQMAIFSDGSILSVRKHTYHISHTQCTAMSRPSCESWLYSHCS